MPNPPSPSAATAMPPAPPPLPFSLTLILAATPSLGIGKNGTLPWPALKKEMGYFARVTKRLPARTNTYATSLSSGNGVPPAGGPTRRNAVVMGRKTWDSIPPRFRPLKDRLNVVVTRDASRVDAGGRTDVEGPLVVESVGAAVERLRRGTAGEDQALGPVERVFVIGGASIYKAALELPEADRVLLTRVETEFECDTFFPVDLEGESGWRRVERERLEDWTGESVEEGGVEEAGVKFEFRMYERER